jgi:hypothetical protein
MQDKRFNQLYRKLEGYNPDPNADPFFYETIHSEVVTPMVWCDKYYRGQQIGVMANIPVIRLAEMYLTRSLLRLRTGDAAGATDDLNVVRLRAGIGPLPGSITEDAIDNERIKEMGFEGDRIDYLRSAKKSIPGGDRGIPVEPFSSSSFVWMLPQSELDLNLNYRDYLPGYFDRIKPRSTIFFIDRGLLLPNFRLVSDSWFSVKQLFIQLTLYHRYSRRYAYPLLVPGNKMFEIGY